MNLDVYELIYKSVRFIKMFLYFNYVCTRLYSFFKLLLLLLVRTPPCAHDVNTIHDTSVYVYNCKVCKCVGIESILWMFYVCRNHTV